VAKGTSIELQVGDRVVRIEPRDGHVEGRVVSVDGGHATVLWTTGRTTRVALSAERKRWRRVPNG